MFVYIIEEKPDCLTASAWLCVMFSFSHLIWHCCWLYCCRQNKIK